MTDKVRDESIDEEEDTTIGLATMSTTTSTLMSKSQSVPGETRQTLTNSMSDVVIAPAVLTCVAGLSPSWTVPAGIAAAF